MGENRRVDGRKVSLYVGAGRGRKVREREERKVMGRRGGKVG